MHSSAQWKRIMLEITTFESSIWIIHGVWRHAYFLWDDRRDLGPFFISVKSLFVHGSSLCCLKIRRRAGKWDGFFWIGFVLVLVFGFWMCWWIVENHCWSVMWLTGQGKLMTHFCMLVGKNWMQNVIDSWWIGNLFFEMILYDFSCW